MDICLQKHQTPSPLGNPAWVLPACLSRITHVQENPGWISGPALQYGGSSSSSSNSS